MRQIIEARLAELQREQQQGGAMLTEMDEQREKLAQTMLRIAGAIQVLQEVLTQPAPVVAGEDGDNARNH